MSFNKLRLGLFFLLLAGCASAPRSQSAISAAPPASPEEARQELRQLEQAIAEDRQVLGLAKPVLPPGERELKTGAALSPPAQEAEPETVDASPVVAGTRSEPASCPGPCRYPRAICRAARRICSLARYLGEADAARRCRLAQQDCQNARQATREQCQGCS